MNPEVFNHSLMCLRSGFPYAKTVDKYGLPMCYHGMWFCEKAYKGDYVYGRVVCLGKMEVMGLSLDDILSAYAKHKLEKKMRGDEK